MIRARLITRFLGALMIMIGASMVVPWLIALFSGIGEQGCFLVSILLSCGGGAALFFGSKFKRKDEISHREAFFIATSGWIIAAGIAALPFYFFGWWFPTVGGKSQFPTFAMAYFESMSGLTTTGATILTNIEALPKSILFWRCLSHWLGGMGIILLGVAILPFLGVGGMQLFRAEVPGPTADKLRPRVAETAKTLWLVYLLLTAIQAVLLFVGGMSVFDAVCHSFSTLATGGFSTRGISVEAYNSVYFEMVIVFFMILAGMNFALHFAWLRGNFKSLWKDEELRFYGIVIFLWSTGIAFALTVSGYYKSFLTALRYSSFQVVSLLTSTGFSSCNFDDWWIHKAGSGAHASVPAIFMVLMLFFIGGSAGSTGGGIKCIRIWLLIKTAYREFVRLIHPKMIRPIKINDQVVPENIINSVIGFFVLFLGTTVVCSLVMTMYGLDLISAFTSVAACIGNIGPGLLKVGPYQNFATIPQPGQWLLIFCMLLGRLEIYTVLILLLPAFWRR